MNTLFIPYRPVKAECAKRAPELDDIGPLKYLNVDVISHFERISEIGDGEILRIQSRDQAAIYNDALICVSEETFDRLIGQEKEAEDGEDA